MISAFNQWFPNNINQETNNLSEMFLEKCAAIGDYVALVLNKTILSTAEFQATREWLRTLRIESIVDFGRYGVTGVSIETMGLFIAPKQKPDKTTVYNMRFNKKYVQRQDYITDSQFPYFIIYRDEDFDIVADKLDFDVFDVFRDRQITKANMCHEAQRSSVWVIKARNIDDGGSGVTHIDGYDAYIDSTTARHLSVFQYVNNMGVYLSPSVTLDPRAPRTCDQCVTHSGSNSPPLCGVPLGRYPAVSAAGSASLELFLSFSIMFC